jgi:hypothetical protein
MFNAARILGRPARLAAVIGGLAALTVGPVAGAGAANATTKTFNLFPTVGQLSCLGVSGQPNPTAKATVTSGNNNDTLTVKLAHFKPGLAFDLFTVQRSNQLADGSPNPTPGFGLAWYQSDVHVGTTGSGSATIHTILLNQIFGFDPDPGVGLVPTNTFNVGFWFNNPADAQPCGFTGFTPFNGEHHAGPVAFITRPNAVTGLGPLCTKPNTSTIPATCNP